MRRLFLLWLAVMAAVSLHADNVSVEDVRLRPGEPQSVGVCLNNTTEYIALQMTLTLPEGISINREGCMLSERGGEGMTLSVGKKREHYSILVTSSGATTFSGTSGPLFYLSLVADETFQSGDATLSGIRFVTPEGERVFMDDCMFSISRVAEDEAYVVLTPNDDGSNTLTFVYDNMRAERTETTYGLEEVNGEPEWYGNGVCNSILQVVFDESFAEARPTMTHSWLREMPITEVMGLENLNTSEVTSVNAMFFCSSLESLDLSQMDFTNVDDSNYLLYGCGNLRSLALSSSMTNLGDNACEGVGSEDNPCVLEVPEGFDFGDVDTTADYFFWKGGWFCIEEPFLLGDANHDGSVTIADIFMTANKVLLIEDENFHFNNADVNQDHEITITDVSLIVDIILSR